MELGFRIRIVNGILDSLSSIPDSKSPGFRIPQAKNFAGSGLRLGFRIPIVSGIPDPWSSIPYSELQSPGLQVPQAKISRVPEFRISLQGRLGMKARRGERPVPSPTDVPKLLPVVHL